MPLVRRARHGRADLPPRRVTRCSTAEYRQTRNCRCRPSYRRWHRQLPAERRRSCSSTATDARCVERRAATASSRSCSAVRRRAQRACGRGRTRCRDAQRDRDACRRPPDSAIASCPAAVADHRRVIRLGQIIVMSRTAVLIEVYTLTRVRRQALVRDRPARATAWRYRSIRRRNRGPATGTREPSPRGTSAAAADGATSSPHPDAHPGEWSREKESRLRADWTTRTVPPAPCSPSAPPPSPPWWSFPGLVTPIRPPTVEQVQAQVDALNQEAAVAAERYNDARLRLDDVQHGWPAHKSAPAPRKRASRVARQNLSAFASATYRFGGIDPTMHFFTSSNPEQFLASSASLSQLSNRQAASLRHVISERLYLAQDNALATEQFEDLSVGEGRPREPEERRRREARRGQAPPRPSASSRPGTRPRRPTRLAGRRLRAATAGVLHGQRLRICRRGHRVRVRPARRPVRLRRRWPELVGLLRADHGRLGGGRCLAATLLARAVQQRTQGVALGAATWRPGLLLLTDQPRRALRR